MTDPGPLIEDLFYQGHPLHHVIAAGDEVGWTKDDVMAVLREHAWDLDGSGRLPRSKRITTPRGLRHPAPTPPAKSKTSTTSRHRTPVPDPLDGHPLPTEPPTPAEALAEQSALDVPVGDGITRPPHFPASPGITVPPPLERRWLPPLDDPRLPQMTASVTVESVELARDIRARVDELAPRANPDGSVNASHVAMEQTLRQRAGLQSYFSELDGPGKFLPDPPLADWEEALVADPFDPGHPALQVPAGFVPGGEDDDPVSAPPASPEPASAARHRRPAAEPTAPPERPARMPCVVKPIMEPRTPIDPAPPRRRPPRPQPPHAQRGRQPAGLDLDDWLDTASRSPSPAVREAADRACRLHEQLHDALDDLVRAEHAHAREQA